MPKQYIGKASRGGSNIQRALAHYVYFCEFIERSLELETRSRDILVCGDDSYLRFDIN
jgi:hypothetical protein